MARSKRTRPYDSSRRQQRAAVAQTRALEVARRLFAERGFAETTMEAIAEEAGVAVPTLYAAFENKSGILARLLGDLVVGEPQASSVLQTDGARAVFAERDPRRVVARFAEHMSQIQARIATTYEVMRNAARTEPAAARALARAQRARRANLTKVVEHLAELGALRSDQAPDEAARTLWVIASPEVRRLLFAHDDVTPEGYRAWLEATLIAALLRGP